jgi:protocatechuate 3,4-dioxygenase beta subunit
MKKRILLIWLAMVLTLATAGIAPAAQTGKTKEGKNTEDKDAKPATPEKGSISGVVQDVKGRPLSDAEVVFIQVEGWEHKGTQMSSAKTGGDGKFAFDLPTTGSMTGYRFYLVMASKAGCAWGSHRIESIAKTIESGPVNLMLGEPKPLAGQVVNRKGEPVSGALVYPQAENQGETLASRLQMIIVFPGMEQFAAKTDAAGRFRFEQLTAGWKAGVLVRHPDYANLSVFSYNNDAAFDVGKEDVRLELAAPGKIQGRLTDSVTSGPVAGVTLIAQARPSLDPLGSKATTDADGRYEIKNLPPGDYSIAPSSSALAGIVQSLSGVKLEEGQVLSGINLTMKPGILVRGRVTDEKTQKGLPDVSVNAYQQGTAGGNAPAWQGAAQTDAEGGFKIIAPEGTVMLNALALEYRSTSQRDQTLTLKQGETPGEVVIALQSNPALRISGVVLDLAGKPVAGAIIRAGFNRDRGDGRTDDAGKFDLHITRNTYPGMTEDLTIYALAPDKNLAAMVPIESDKEEIVLKIQLKTGGVIIGRVLDEEKKPLAKAKVQLQRVITHGNSRTIMLFGEPAAVDAEGRFRIYGLCEGADYWLNITAKGYGSERIEEVKGAAGQTMDRGDITLPRADVYVDVSVVDTFGNPVEGVNLYAQGEKQPEFRDRSATGKDGKLRLGPFVPGSVIISARKQGYSYAQTDLTLTNGKNEQLTIEMVDEKGASTRLSTGTAAPKLEGVDWLVGKGDLAGKDGLEALKGKPVALVFFAPGNRSSMAALNRLQALQKEIGENKLAVVAVCDASVTSDELKKLWSDKGFAFDLGRVADGDRQGWTGPAFRAYEVRALPGIILISPEGRIHQRDVSISDLEKAVRSLVGAK